MYQPEAYAIALLFIVSSMVCWGSDQQHHETFAPPSLATASSSELRNGSWSLAPSSQPQRAQPVAENSPSSITSSRRTSFISAMAGGSDFQCSQTCYWLPPLTSPAWRLRLPSWNRLGAGRRSVAKLSDHPQRQSPAALWWSGSGCACDHSQRDGLPATQNRPPSLEFAWNSDRRCLRHSNGRVLIPSSPRPPAASTLLVPTPWPSSSPSASHLRHSVNYLFNATTSGRRDPPVAMVGYFSARGSSSHF